MIKYALFDLDGTLTDPAKGITNSIMYALKKLDIEPPERSELLEFIGPPLIPIFKKRFGFDDNDAKLALKYYREYFAPKGILENEIYPGIAELLKELYEKRTVILLATSKPEEFTKQILEHFGIAKYFSAICGNTLNKARPTKSEVVAYVKSLYPDIYRENALMIGDRHHDVDGAAENGLDTVGVLYGYGSREELSGAKYITEDINALKKNHLERRLNLCGKILSTA